MILGCHPFHGVGEVLLFFRAFAQIVGVVVAEEFVVEGAVAFLKHAIHFVATHFLLPIKIHGVVAVEHSAHVLLHHFHVHHIIVGTQSVTNTELSAVGKIQCHQHTGVGLLHRCEIEVLRVVALGAGVEHKAVFVFTR